MASRNRKRIDLALQGGGSHGAFTWGVLDRILEDERIEISAVSGTSAGAMNAVVVAEGLQRDKRNGARSALAEFWRAVSESARFSPIQRTLWDKLTNNYQLEFSPGLMAVDQMTRLFSPYDLNPFNLNPLRDLLSDVVDFERVNACGDMKVFVTATNIRTGRAKIFSQPTLSADAIMASACLPNVFQAVEIDGESYWDGGYIGNPALFPLVEDPQCRDLLIVQINPLVREEVPRSARDISNRVNEISFNASLIKELRAIHLLHQIIDAEELELERYRDMRLHIIHADNELRKLGASTKLNAEWDFLTRLRDRGRAWAENWMASHYDDLGMCSTLDLDELFQDGFRPPTPAPDRERVRADARARLKAELRDEIEAEVRADLQSTINAEVEKRVRAEQASRTNKSAEAKESPETRQSPATKVNSGAKQTSAAKETSGAKQTPGTRQNSGSNQKSGTRQSAKRGTARTAKTTGKRG